MKYTKETPTFVELMAVSQGKVFYCTEVGRKTCFLRVLCTFSMSLEAHENLANTITLSPSLKDVQTPNGKRKSNPVLVHCLQLQ